ncbi:MAG: hypothetical protein ACLP4W_12200 [Mycobacterium sp.]
MTYRFLSVFFCGGHARTGSDSEYVAELPAAALPERCSARAGQLCAHTS